MNRERTHIGGLYVADDTYGLDRMLANQPYHNRHPKVPRDFGILPLMILVHHVDETLSQVQKLSRDITSTEKRIADGEIRLEDNGDYKLLNRQVTLSSMISVRFSLAVPGITSSTSDFNDGQISR